MRYHIFVKSSLKHTREECESKRAYVFFRCLIVYQDLVNCYFCFVLLPLGPEKG